MIRTLALEADLATIPGYAGARTVVALPPSLADDTITNGGGFGAYADQYAGTAIVYLAGDMRVYVNGTLVRRAYDSTLEAP